MVKNRVSIIMAAGNDEDVIEDALASATWADEIIVVLSEHSKDKTKRIASRYTEKIYITKNHLGYQRNYGIQKSTGDWILILDTDERVPFDLKMELTQRLNEAKYVGYFIPYKNYFLGHPIKWGNQSYKKLRLFKKNQGVIENLKTHPEIAVKGATGNLKSSLKHYSFRSIPQILNKFTYYAREDVDRLRKSEKPTIWKLVIYPLHMFWAIFVEGEGWRDGIWGLGVALCFTYYEFARYYFLLLYRLKQRS